MEKSRFVITNLKQGVNNPNRVNVFVNSKYALSLDVAQVVDLGVKVGLEISEDELEEFKKASEYGKLYQRTLEWVLVRPRSVRETRDYLQRKLKNTFRGPYATNEERNERSFARNDGPKRARPEKCLFWLLLNMQPGPAKYINLLYLCGAIYKLNGN